MALWLKTKHRSIRSENTSTASLNSGCSDVLDGIQLSPPAIICKGCWWCQLLSHHWMAIMSEKSSLVPYCIRLSSHRPPDRPPTFFVNKEALIIWIVTQLESYGQSVSLSLHLYSLKCWCTIKCSTLGPKTQHQFTRWQTSKYPRSATRCMFRKAQVIIPPCTLHHNSHLLSLWFITI